MTRKEMLLLRQSIASLPVSERERVVNKLRNPTQFRMYVALLEAVWNSVEPAMTANQSPYWLDNRFLRGGTDISLTAAANPQQAERIRQHHLGIRVCL
jgi:hypothetical protein